MKKPVMRACFIAGFVSLGIGVAGFAFPAVPSGPFLFIAALFFMHCCPRFISWFKKTPICRCYIDDFIRERSMSRRNKIKTLVIGTLLLGAAFFALKPLWAKAMIVVLAVIKYYYIVFCVWTSIENGHGLCKEDADGDQKDA